MTWMHFAKPTAALAPYKNRRIQNPKHDPHPGFLKIKQLTLVPIPRISALQFVLYTLDILGNLTIYFNVDRARGFNSCMERDMDWYRVCMVVTIGGYWVLQVIAYLVVTDQW